MEKLNIGSLIVGIISTIFSVGLSYWLWGRTTKRLNNLLIEEKEREKRNNKKAKVVAKVKKSSEDNIDLSYFYLEIHNKGKNKARNVNFEELEDQEIDFHRIDKFPLDLEPNQTIIVNMSTYSNKKVKINLNWDDDFSKNREKEFLIPIL